MQPSIIIPLVAMSLPLILVPVILGLRHARLERQLEHAERMKALELGRMLPKDEPWWSPSRISVAFGVAVPVGVFYCAWMASKELNASPIAIWTSASVVGLAGVISGARLAYRQIEHSLGAPAASDPYLSTVKTPLDADAFDVVGRRG